MWMCLSYRYRESLLSIQYTNIYLFVEVYMNERDLGIR